eukprot:tig00001668_g9552.t1
MIAEGRSGAESVCSLSIFGGYCELGLIKRRGSSSAYELLFPQTRGARSSGPLLRGARVSAFRACISITRGPALRGAALLVGCPFSVRHALLEREPPRAGGGLAIAHPQRCCAVPATAVAEAGLDPQMLAALALVEQPDFDPRRLTRDQLRQLQALLQFGAGAGRAQATAGASRTVTLTAAQSLRAVPRRSAPTRDPEQAAAEEAARQKELERARRKLSLLPVYRFGAANVSTSGEGNECPICMLAYEEGDQVRTLPCFHRFHADCVGTWLVGGSAVKKTCPCARPPAGPGPPLPLLTGRVQVCKFDPFVRRPARPAPRRRLRAGGGRRAPRRPPCLLLPPPRHNHLPHPPRHLFPPAPPTRPARARPGGRGRGPAPAPAASGSEAAAAAATARGPGPGRAGPRGRGGDDGGDLMGALFGFFSDEAAPARPAAPRPAPRPSSPSPPLPPPRPAPPAASAASPAGGPSAPRAPVALPLPGPTHPRPPAPHDPFRPDAP